MPDFLYRNLYWCISYLSVKMKYCNTSIYYFYLTKFIKITSCRNSVYSFSWQTRSVLDVRRLLGRVSFYTLRRCRSTDRLKWFPGGTSAVDGRRRDPFWQSPQAVVLRAYSDYGGSEGGGVANWTVEGGAWCSSRRLCDSRPGASAGWSVSPTSRMSWRSVQMRHWLWYICWF